MFSATDKNRKRDERGSPEGDFKRSNHADCCAVFFGSTSNVEVEHKKQWCAHGVLPLEWTVLNKLIRLCSFITAGLYFYAAVA